MPGCNCLTALIERTGGLMSLWRNVQFSFGTRWRSPRVGVTVPLALAVGISAGTVVAERRPVTSASNSSTAIDLKSANTELDSLSAGLVSLRGSTGFPQLLAAE